MKCMQFESILTDNAEYALLMDALKAYWQGGNSVFVLVLCCTKYTKQIYKYCVLFSKEIIKLW